jgi:hypothetical protein
MRKTTVKALDSGRGDSLALSGTELESYRLAKRILGGLEEASPLHAAIEEYVADAQSTVLKPITATALVEEFIASKTADGVSERYIQDCRSRLGRFAKDFKSFWIMSICFWVHHRNLSQTKRSVWTDPLRRRRQLWLLMTRMTVFCRILHVHMLSSVRLNKR